jgi:DNA-binding XRE family transcriptional regulator
MTNLTININLPDSANIDIFIEALKKAGISDVTTNTKDFIPIEDAMKDIFPGMSHNEIIGGLLKTARKNAKLTQTKLAEFVGIQKEELSDMEHGKSPINTVMAKKLGKALNIDYHVFL